MDGHIAILNRFLSSLDVNRDVGLAVARGDNIGAIQNPACGQVAVSNGNLAIDNLDLGLANFSSVVLEEMDGHIAILNRFLDNLNRNPHIFGGIYGLGLLRFIGKGPPIGKCTFRNGHSPLFQFTLVCFESSLFDNRTHAYSHKVHVNCNFLTICKRCKRHAHDNHEHSRQQSQQTSFEVRFLHVNFSYSLSIYLKRFAGRCPKRIGLLAQ